jgi:hypothetical protein
MWLQYRKTVIPTQLFIVVVSIALYWKGGFPLFVVGVFFLVMQIGEVIGAAWATRLQRKIDQQRDRLPLERLL